MFGNVVVAFCELAQTDSTQFSLNVKMLSLFPGLEESDAVGVLRQLFVFADLLQLALAVRLAFEPLARLLDSIVAPVLFAFDSEDISK